MGLESLDPKVYTCGQSVIDVQRCPFLPEVIEFPSGGLFTVSTTDNRDVPCVTVIVTKTLLGVLGGGR